jgi:hypothetical protein
MAISEAVKIAERFEPRIRRELLKAFEAMRARVPLRKVTEALQSRGIEGVMSLLDNIGDDLAPVQASIRDAIRESGRSTIGVMPKGAVLNSSFAFDTLNPATVDFIRNYELNLIRSISENTRAAVRNSLRRDIVAGRNPIDTARTFRANIGLTAQQEHAVANYRKSLETLDRRALARNLRDKRFDRTVTSAIERNKPLSRDKVDQLVGRYRERYIKYRTQVISRTESLRATTVGQQAAIKQMQATGAIDGNKVMRFWVPTHDMKTRDSHLMIPEMNPLGIPLNGFYQTPLGALAYPRDPNGRPDNTIQCRCSERFKLVEG